MKGDLARRAQQVFEAVIDQPPGAVRETLALECGDDLELRSAVESLLEQDGEASQFLAEPYLAKEAPELEVAEPAAPDPLVGTTLAQFRIVRRIGEGGMGVVYLGERSDDQYRQEVAIKVLRRTLVGGSLESRFKVERQILASLEHPCITRLLVGGTTPLGEPYLVMEHVRGAPITDYCDRHRLTVTQRIELFCTVCDGVRYAHQNLVVHRDLKPSNLLVRDDGTPKVLDFGIAKLLEPWEEANTTATQLRALTPNYASPEHILGERITPASDVFSLGLVLYQLLSGHRAREWAGREPTSIADEMRRHEPMPPSAAVSSAEGCSAAEAQAIGTARSTSPEALRRRLRGDLDMIVLQALRFEPDRRFGSAAELASDLRRHLEGRPVTARPATIRYRLSKYVRRNALPLLLGLFVAAFGLTSTVQSRRVASERDQAELERTRAERISEFLLRSFELADPVESEGESITVREVLEQGELRLRNELADQPELQGSLLKSIGVFYTRMGSYAKATKAFDEALALLTGVHGPEHHEVADTYYEMSLLAQARSEYKQAEGLARRSLALHRTLLDPSDPHLAEEMSSLAVILMHQGRDPEAEPLLREAVALHRRSGSDPEDRMSPLQNLAVLLYRRGEVAESENLLKDVLELKRATLGDRHPSLANAYFNLAIIQTDLAAFSDAEDSHRQALRIRREVFDPDHPLVLASMTFLGRTQHKRGDLAAAESLLREALAARRRVAGDRDTAVSDNMNALADLLTEKGDFAEAEKLCEQALSIQRDVLGERHRDVAKSLATLASARAGQGAANEAEQLLRDALDIRREALGDEHTATADLMVQLANLLADRGVWDEAEILASRSDRIYLAELPDEHWKAASVLVIKGRILAGRGRLAEAEAALSKAEEALREKRGQDALWTRQALRELNALRAQAPLSE